MFVEWLFWISLAAVGYVYLGYPAVLVVWTRLRRDTVRKGDYEPQVTIVIAAHNERHNIERRLSNCLELDYPKHRLQIILSLDGPTDGTERAAARFAACGVQILHAPVRCGKPAALNLAVAHATGDVIVFGDARQVFAQNVIRELVANFRDPRVGVVTGELVLLNEDSAEACDAIGLYWRYEKTLRSLESSIHSVLGATGAIYAIRRELYRPIPEDVLLDDVMLPMLVVLSGRRSVFEPAAKAYDRVSSSPEAEYGRKVRTLMGNYQLLTHMPELLHFGRNPVFFQFVSHKLGRLVVPYFLVILFVSNLFLARGLYRIPLVLQLAWYSLVLVGIFISRGSSCGRAPSHAPRTRAQDQL